MRGVWGTVDAGATAFTDLTPNLAPLNIIRPTSVEFISSNGVDALLVGGLNNIANAQSPIATADSDGTGTLANWRAFGVGLPNTIVNQMSYNENADVLAVSLFGRGAWLLYDVTAYYPDRARTALRPGRQRFRTRRRVPDQRQPCQPQPGEVRLRHAHHRRHGDLQRPDQHAWAAGST